MNRGKMGRILLIAFVVIAVFLGGTLVQPGIEVANQYRDRQALLQRMATDPAYQVIEAVESYNTRVTVLNVLLDGDYVSMWILHDVTNITEEEWLPYLVDTFAHLYEVLVDVYDGKRGYAIVVANHGLVATVEGDKVQIVGISAYLMSPQAVNSFLSEPTGDTLDRLYAQGSFVFQWIYQQGVSLAEVLPREPGYIWPWNGDCEPCGS